MNCRPLRALLPLGALSLLLLAQAGAAPRDPMQPPVPLAAPGAPRAAPEPAASAPQPRHLLVVDGRRYVMDGNRRRGVGDLLGEARIERIEDAAVVVRSATGAQRLPLFGGVVKQAAPEARATATDRPSSSGEQP